MIPNNKWFPQSLLERAAWYANFNTQTQATGNANYGQPSDTVMTTINP